MISETTPLNQWSQDDLIKLAACIESVAEMSKDPRYIKFSERIIPVIKDALTDVAWEYKRIANNKPVDL